MCERIKASTSKEAVNTRGKQNWNVPVSDHHCGPIWDTAQHEQVRPPVKKASATLLGPQLPGGAFEPSEVSTAISAC